MGCLCVLDKAVSLPHPPPSAGPLLSPLPATHSSWGSGEPCRKSRTRHGATDCLQFRQNHQVTNHQRVTGFINQAPSSLWVQQAPLGWLWSPPLPLSLPLALSLTSQTWQRRIQTSQTSKVGGAQPPSPRGLRKDRNIETRIDDTLHIMNGLGEPPVSTKGQGPLFPSGCMQSEELERSIL